MTTTETTADEMWAIHDELKDHLDNVADIITRFEGATREHAEGVDRDDPVVEARGARRMEHAAACFFEATDNLGRA